MHEKDDKNLKFDIWLNITTMILASAFGILRHFVALLVIPMRRKNGSVNDAWQSNPGCCTVGNSVITMKTKDLDS